MRRVLVTGGGSGIGASIARAFLEKGDVVTITGRSADRLAESDPEREMTHVDMDVTDEAAVAALFARPFHVVIANAGIGTAAPLTEVSLADWRRTIDTNLTGVFLTFREALRGMEDGGRLIAIASTASLQGGAGLAAYSASKHGVLGLVRSVAKEVARKGITCNAICPGFVATDMADGAVRATMKARGVDRETAERIVTSGNPMKRMIDPGEVTSAALWLASPGASSVNGHALSVSGGEI